jgi:hypothetical protein
MLASRIWLGALLVLTILTCFPDPALALETAEKTLSFEGQVPRGGSVVIDNLLGSVRIVSGTTPGQLRVEAHVVAEAKTAEEAKSLADSIRLQHRTDSKAVRVHVLFPVDRIAAYRRPKAGVKGWITRWAGSMMRGSSEVEYDGQLVQIGKDRKATGLAVYLTLTLPYDVHSSVRQAVGPIEGRALRGQVSLATVDGDVLAERCFGGLEVSSERGAVRVLAFQGDDLRVETTTGAMELLNVRAARMHLRTEAGAIGGSGLTAERLQIESTSGSIRLAAVEPKTIQVRTDSGRVDLATNLKTAREFLVETETGDVTLRVGPLAHFDLTAETKSGEVKMLGMTLDLTEQEGQVSQLRQGQGGPNLRVVAAQGSVTVRPYDGSRLDLLVGGR